MSDEKINSDSTFLEKLKKRVVRTENMLAAATLVGIGGVGAQAVTHNITDDPIAIKTADEAGALGVGAFVTAKMAQSRLRKDAATEDKTPSSIAR